MSYEIVYDRKFIKVGDGTYIPFALYGCNNVTTCEIDSRGRHYEKAIRNWESMVYSCFGDRNRLNFTPDEMTEGLKKAFADGKYSSSTKYNGRFFNEESEIKFFENGCKNAISIEEAVEHCWDLQLKVTGYMRGDLDSKEVFSACPKTTDELVTALKKARFAAKLYGDEDMTCYMSLRSSISTPMPSKKVSSRRSRSAVNADIKKQDEYFLIQLDNGNYFVKRSSTRYWSSFYQNAGKPFKTEKEAQRYLAKNTFIKGTVVKVTK